jgi:hypothetical protein
MGLENTSGKLALLRVHDRGTKYGPPTDSIDVEVVAQFVGRPQEAFGFQLRSGADTPVREGMLSLLREGFVNNLTVHMDYERDTVGGKRNGVARRVWLTRP